MKIAFFGSSLVRPTGTARRPTTAASSARCRLGHRRHLLRAGRLRAAAASRHRGSATGRGWSCTGDEPRRSRRALERPRRRVDRQGQRRRRVRRVARSRRARIASGPHTLVVFWDVDAPATLDRMAARSRTIPFAALIPRYDMIFTYGGGDRSVAPTRRWARASACRSTTRSIRRRTIPCRPSRASRAISRSSAIGCPIARRASTNSSSAAAARRQPAISARRQRLGRQARRANVRYLGHVYTRDHNAFNCYTPRGVSTSAARAWRGTASRRRRACSRRPAPAACIITDAWEGIEMFSSRSARCWSRRTARRWPPVSNPSPPNRLVKSAGAHRRAYSASTPIPTVPARFIPCSAPG